MFAFSNSKLFLDKGKEFEDEEYLMSLANVTVFNANCCRVNFPEPNKERVKRTVQLIVQLLLLFKMRYFSIQQT